MINAVNEQFSRFVSFAEERMDAGKETAIASKGDIEKGGGTTLEERKIKVSNRFDWVSLSIFRWKGARSDNNAVRDIFKKCIAEMFGGEANIPQSVKDAMLLKDYGCGKPLTARRIIAVKTAIENLHRSNIFGPDTDAHGVFANKAIAAGFTHLDFGRINTAVNLLMQAKPDMSAADAFNEVITDGTAANLAMKSGSLCMKDAKSFANGLERLGHIAVGDMRNTDVASYCGAADKTGGLHEVAENLEYKFENLLGDAERLRIAAGLPENILDDIKSTVNTISERMHDLADDLKNGTLTDRKDVYKELFSNSDISSLNAKVQTLVGKFSEKDRRKPAVEEFVQYMIAHIKEATSGYDKLSDVYKVAVAQDMTGVAKSKLSAAANEASMTGKRPCIVPDEIMDTVGEFLKSDPFVNFPKVEEFCKNLEKYGDSALRFSEEQKKELKGLIDTAFGAGPKADKILKEVVDKFEVSFFADQIHFPGKFGEQQSTKPELILHHFKTNPETLFVFDPGFKLNTDEDTETLKNDIKNRLSTIFNNRLAGADLFTSLASGLMPQSVREYNVGYVTFNGQNIPNAQLGTEFPQLQADSQTPERKGFAEFLERTFDANHKKMRQFVSLSCSMAEGFGGAFDALMDHGDGNTKISGFAREKYAEKGIVTVSADRLPDDNYNIEVAENGDVKIFLTRRVRNKMCTIMNDQGVYVPQTLRSIPNDLMTAGDVKITATMTIRNATDAELGNKMPEFTIDDIKQEVV